MRSPPRKCRPLAKQRTGRFPLHARASLSRSSSYLSAPLPAAPVRPSRPRRPHCAKGAGCVFARDPKDETFAQEAANERCASFFAHLPRSLAPPATSPRRSPKLRFVPAVLLVPAAREAQTTDKQFAREAVTVPSFFSHHPSTSRSTSSLSAPLAAAPLRPRRPRRPGRAKGEGGAPTCPS
jgi:hypothetical protein